MNDCKNVSIAALITQDSDPYWSFHVINEMERDFSFYISPGSLFSSQFPLVFIIQGGCMHLSISVVLTKP